MAEQPINLTNRNGQAEVIDCPAFPKSFAQMGDFDHAGEV
jgi:hypothetical protein